MARKPKSSNDIAPKSILKKKVHFKDQATLFAKVKKMPNRRMSIATPNEFVERPSNTRTTRLQIRRMPVVPKDQPQVTSGTSRNDDLTSVATENNEQLGAGSRYCLEFPQLLRSRAQSFFPRRFASSLTTPSQAQEIADCPSLMTIEAEPQPPSPQTERNEHIKPIKDWTAQDVFNFMVIKGYARHAPIFVEQCIDGEALLLCEKDDLNKMGVPYGVGLKMWRDFKEASADALQ